MFDKKLKFYRKSIVHVLELKFSDRILSYMVPEKTLARFNQKFSFGLSCCLNFVMEAK